jgi:hypothetical protein
VSQTLRGLGFDEVIEIYDAQATRRNLLTKLGQTLAELTDESSLGTVRDWKKAQKAAKKDKQDRPLT